MKRALLLAAIGIIATSGASSAVADPTRGPLRVMGPDGTIVRISSEAAEAWWVDYREIRCVTCREPHQAAKLLHEVENALGGRFHGGPRFLIVVESIRSRWPRAWVFYPSSDETSAYVMKPGGVGSGVAPLRWDAWYRATSRMESIILDAMASTPSPTAGQAGDPGGSGPARVAWIATWMVLVALVVGLGVAGRRGIRRREPSGC